MKVQSSTLDDAFQGMMKTTPHMQLTQHGVMHLTEGDSFVWFEFFLCSHTFVVMVNSFRTFDLTRNVTAGEGTGQVNINPDKSTMVDWNFDRIMDTENIKHHNIQNITQEWEAQTQRQRG